MKKPSVARLIVVVALVLFQTGCKDRSVSPEQATEETDVWKRAIEVASRGNSAYDGRGGGLLLSRSSATLANSTITGNRAGREGGGLSVLISSGGTCGSDQLKCLAQ